MSVASPSMPESPEVSVKPAKRVDAPMRLLDPAILGPAIGDAFRKLNPRTMVHNPVMFVVEVGSVLTSFILLRDMWLQIGGSSADTNVRFVGQLTLWLWFTVLFANFAEAIAEGRGKAQADSLRRTRQETTARRLVAGQAEQVIPASELAPGDIVRVVANEIIPNDGEVIDGVAFVSEAAITGESAPVLKEPGTDVRSSVTGGTTVVSDWLIIRITAEPGRSFLDRMIGLVEGASRQKTPNEIALTILLCGLTITFMLVTMTLRPFATYANSPVSTVVLIALLVTLIPTTIGALVSAIGIAGMDRLVRHNVLAMSGRAVEAAGDVDMLLLDKTGTITYGNRMASEFLPVGGHAVDELAQAALESSLADETPEGRSIVALAEQLGYTADRTILDRAELVPFRAETRVSGIRVHGHTMLKGAADAVLRRIGGSPRADIEEIVDRVAGQGGTPLVVAIDDDIVGVVYLKDTVKPGMRERFDQMRQMGIRTVMITGDNPLTAQTIAREAGVDDFVAEARPEDKMQLILEAQTSGRLVAMTGDGTNDAPALAQSDVGVAMNSGTAAAKEAANMVDLDSDPTKLIDIVAIGKQLLITRGALTTFSVANDVAKYFAIIPALFVVAYPDLERLNIMALSTPDSAILSAVIFNALIIIALIPLALHGVAFRPVSAAALLRRNLLIYGLGGLLVPFAGIKAIDIIITSVGLA